MGRTFEDKPATRAGGVPLLLGLMGPGGVGKTWSALELATGIQRVYGGEIYLVDTEGGRSQYYSDRFSFRHVPFEPPFDSMSYADAAIHCVKRGAGVLIIDTMSLEHDGEGGVLDQHDIAIDGGAKDPSAWIAPKRARKKMEKVFERIRIPTILCYRAEEKNSFDRGKQPAALGFVPVYGGTMFYSMTACALLLPGAYGVPTWAPKESGEKRMVKLPDQFRKLVPGPGKPLDADTGERMARWAAGDSNQAHAELVAAITDSSSLDALNALVPRLAAAKDNRLITPSEYESLRSAFAAKRESLQLALQPAGDWGDTDSPPDEDEVRDPNDPESY